MAGPYTIRRPRLRSLTPLLGLAAFVVIATSTGLVPPFATVFVAAFVAITVYNAWQHSLVLRVDRAGVALGRGIERAWGNQQLDGASVPWSSIREVVLLTPGPFGGEGPPEVGVRLHPGAPLPSGVTAIVHDAGRPDALDSELLARMPASRFDRARLADAVAAFGGGVPLVDRGVRQ